MTLSSCYCFQVGVSEGVRQESGLPRQLQVPREHSREAPADRERSAASHGEGSGTADPGRHGQTRDLGAGASDERSSNLKLMT